MKFKKGYFSKKQVTMNLFENVLILIYQTYNLIK